MRIPHLLRRAVRVIWRTAMDGGAQADGCDVTMDESKVECRRSTPHRTSSRHAAPRTPRRPSRVAPSASPRSKEPILLFQFRPYPSALSLQGAAVKEGCL